MSSFVNLDVHINLGSKVFPGSSFANTIEHIRITGHKAPVRVDQAQVGGGKLKHFGSRIRRG